VVNKKRPVNLDFSTMSLPVTSIVSITHRLSGVILFFAVGVMLWVLDTSLASKESFFNLKAILGHPVSQLVIWASLAALAYHMIAGIRHLIMDFGVGEDSFNSGRVSAWGAAGVAAIVITFITVWIFLW
jgi:succinate dehydrogenase / fumarate reductase cytochrome b subunit